MQSPWQVRWSRLFLVLPLISLVICAISWLRFGIDLPLLDDWRDYNSRMIGSFDLEYLFTSANDTLYPVGKFLDSLAFRHLDGNTVAYQFLSMATVLGLALYFQWRLLILVLKDRLLAASAYVFTLLMLQPDSYWGWQNMAYHQALPVVCILASIFIILRPEWNPRRDLPSLLVIGLFSGFAYISGAFAILAISIVWLVAAYCVKASLRRRFLIGGISLLLAGLVTSAAQFWVIAFKQKGTHRPDAPMGYPFESDFWYYFLGKIGRSLMLPSRYPEMSLAIVIVSVVALLAMLVYFVRLFMKREVVDLEGSRLGLTFLSIFAVVFVYLCLVSAGRVNLRPIETHTPTEIFAFGFARFHYFWVTILWPWVAAVVILFYQKSCESRGKPIGWKIPIGMASLLCLTIISAGAFNHSRFFKKTMLVRAEGIRCILAQLPLGKEVICPELDIFELSHVYSFGVEKGASFVRGMPKSLRPNTPNVEH